MPRGEAPLQIVWQIRALAWVLGPVLLPSYLHCGFLLLWTLLAVGWGGNRLWDASSLFLFIAIAIIYCTLSGPGTLVSTSPTTLLGTDSVVTPSLLSLRVRGGARLESGSVCI